MSRESMTSHGGQRNGQLFFVGYAFDETLDVWWESIQGNLSEGKQWQAMIRFSPDYEVPEQAAVLIFRALSDTSVQIRFRPENGQAMECVIHSVEGLDDGTITISSPDLGSA